MPLCHLRLTSFNLMGAKSMLLCNDAHKPTFQKSSPWCMFLVQGGVGFNRRSILQGGSHFRPFSTICISRQASITITTTTPTATKLRIMTPSSIDGPIAKNALGYPLLHCKTPVPSDIQISQDIVKDVGLLSIADLAKQYVFVCFMDYCIHFQPLCHDDGSCHFCCISSFVIGCCH